MRLATLHRNLDTMQAHNCIRLIPSTNEHDSISTLHLNSTVPDSIYDVYVVQIGRCEDVTGLEHQEDSSRGGDSPPVIPVRHCDIWCSDARWYIKDVGSDIGTFLNCVRLSKPNTMSPRYLLRNGDFVQLGQRETDGDGEVSTRSFVVRMMSSDPTGHDTETSRPWKRSIESQEREGSAKRNSQDCRICSTPILQNQASIAAPCNHMWHYRCMQHFVQATNIKGFLCPICLERRLSPFTTRSSWQMLRHPRPSKRYLFPSILR